MCRLQVCFKNRWGVVLAAFILVAGLAPARGLVPVAGGELYLTGEVRGVYDSNLFANRNDVDDFYLTVTPELEFQRQTGVLHLDLRSGIVVRRHLDHSVLNAEDLYAEAELRYPVVPGRTRTDQDLGLHYRESTRAVENTGSRPTDEETGDVAEDWRFGADYGIRHHLTEKTAVRSRLAGERREFRRGRWSDRDTYSAGADAIWIYSEKLDLFSGYRFRRTLTRRRPEGVRSVSSRDHQVSAGAEGELLPKVSGSLRAGYQIRDFDARDRGSRDQFSFDADTTWEATAQTQVSLGASRDFRTSADERDVDSTSVTLTATHRLTEPYRLDARLHYLHERFGATATTSGRSEHTVGAESGIRYSLTERASAALAYRVARRESDDNFFTHTRHIVDLSARMRF